MRRVVFTVLSLICVAALLTGCFGELGSFFENETVPCEHSYETTVTKSPTYEEEGERTRICEKCGDTYTESIPKLEKHQVPKAVLEQEMRNCRVRISVFSVSVGEIMNAALKSPKIKHLSGKEAVSSGHISVDESRTKLDNVYVMIVSGEAAVNPDLPYLTEYEENAIVVALVFDDNDQLIDQSVTLCKNLQTYAILMTSGY